jgi:hypothetical protein
MRDLPWHQRVRSIRKHRCLPRSIAVLSGLLVGGHGHGWSRTYGMLPIVLITRCTTQRHHLYRACQVEKRFTALRSMRRYINAQPPQVHQLYAVTCCGAYAKTVTRYDKARLPNFSIGFSFLFTTPFGLQIHTQDLETFHSIQSEISTDLPGPCQSFVRQIYSLSAAHFVVRSTINKYPTVSTSTYPFNFHHQTTKPQPCSSDHTPTVRAIASRRLAS